MIRGTHFQEERIHWTRTTMMWVMWEIRLINTGKQHHESVELTEWKRKVAHEIG